jgi:hypothetical protein
MQIRIRLHFDAEPDPFFQFDAYPDPDPQHCCMVEKSWKFYFPSTVKAETVLKFSPTITIHGRKIM